MYFRMRMCLLCLLINWSIRKKPLCLPMYGAYLPQYTKVEIQGEGVFQEVQKGFYLLRNN